MQSNFLKKLTRPRTPHILIFFILLSTCTSTKTYPIESSHSLGIAIVAGCGSFACYKLAQRLRFYRNDFNFLYKASLSPILQLAVVGTAGLAGMSVMHAHMAYQAAIPQL